MNVNNRNVITGADVEIHDNYNLLLRSEIWVSLCFLERVPTNGWNWLELAGIPKGLPPAVPEAVELPPRAQKWLDGADPNILKDSDQLKLTRQDLALLVAFATGWAPFATTPQPLSDGFWSRCPPASKS